MATSKLVLKVLSTSETVTVTDAEFQNIITAGNLRFYEIQERVGENKADVPQSVIDAIAGTVTDSPQTDTDLPQSTKKKTDK